MIVAEVILSLILEDPNSYLNAEYNWKPNIPTTVKDEFTIADLIKFVYSD